MKIPKSFELLGETIHIIKSQDLLDKTDNVGEADYRHNTITIQVPIGGINRPISYIEATYLHEVIHFILHRMGRDELNEDNSFVELFARLLHQILITSMD